MKHFLPIFMLIFLSWSCTSFQNNDSKILQELSEIKGLIKKTDSVSIVETLHSGDTVVRMDTVQITKVGPRVQLTAVQMLYRGLDNPVSLVAENSDKLQIKIKNGTIGKRTNSSFTIRPGKLSTALFTIKNEKGDTLESQEYKVKNVPDPKPYFAGVTGSGNVPKKKLMAAQGVIAKMENFEFDLKYNVISYTLVATLKGKVVAQKSNGPRITGSMKTVISHFRPGQRVFVTGIKAKGPDGAIRDIGNIAIKVI